MKLNDKDPKAQEKSKDQEGILTITDAENNAVEKNAETQQK